MRERDKREGEGDAARDASTRGRASRVFGETRGAYSSVMSARGRVCEPSGSSCRAAGAFSVWVASVRSDERKLSNRSSLVFPTVGRQCRSRGGSWGGGATKKTPAGQAEGPGARPRHPAAQVGGQRQIFRRNPRTALQPTSPRWRRALDCTDRTILRARAVQDVHQVIGPITARRRTWDAVVAGREAHDARERQAGRA